MGRYCFVVPKCTQVKQALACGHSPCWIGSRQTPFGNACARILRFNHTASLEMGTSSPSTTLPVISTTTLVLRKLSLHGCFRGYGHSVQSSAGSRAQKLLHNTLRHVVVDHPRAD